MTPPQPARTLRWLPTFRESAQGIVQVHDVLGPHVQFETIERPYTGARVTLLMDSRLPTHSTKYRYAIGAVAGALQNGDERLVMSSSGNAGVAVAEVAAHHHLPLTVFVPSSCPPPKRELIVANGAELFVVAGNYLDTNNEANSYALRHDIRCLSPDNDPFGIAGAGSAAFDIFGLLPNDVWNVYSPYVGGGSYAGLVTGWHATAALLKEDVAKANFFAVTMTDTQGTWPARLGDRDIYTPNSAEDYFAVYEGDVEPDSPVIAAAGPNHEMTRAVTRTEIEDAAYLAWRVFDEKLEATAAAAVAAALRDHPPLGSNMAIVTGSNVDERAWQQAIDRAHARAATPTYEFSWMRADRLQAQRNTHGRHQVSSVSTAAITDTGFARQLQGLGLAPLDPEIVRADVRNS